MGTDFWPTMYYKTIWLIAVTHLMPPDWRVLASIVDYINLFSLILQWGNLAGCLALLIF